MTGLLNPKSSEKKIVGHSCCMMILVVYLGNGVFHPVAVPPHLQISFGRDLKLPKKLRNLKKKCAAPLS